MKNDNKYLSQIKLRETERQLSFTMIRVRQISLLIQIRQLIMSCFRDMLSTQKWEKYDCAILSNVQSLQISNYHPP